MDWLLATRMVDSMNDHVPAIAIAVMAVLILVGIALTVDNKEDPAPTTTTKVREPRAWVSTTTREQRINVLRATCFRDKGYFRLFGNTAFCTKSLGHTRGILWEKEI